MTNPKNGGRVTTAEFKDMQIETNNKIATVELLVVTENQKTRECMRDIADGLRKEMSDHRIDCQKTQDQTNSNSDKIDRNAEKIGDVTKEINNIHKESRWTSAVAGIIASAIGFLSSVFSK